MKKLKASAVPSPDAPPFVVIPKGAKPSKAASTDHTRPALQNGHLRKTDDGWQLFVTDSYGLACIPVEVTNATDTEPAEGPVPFAALKHAEKAGGLRSSNGTIEPCDQFGGGTDVLYRRSANVQPPDWDRLLDDSERPTKPFRVGLDTKLLRQIAEALGSDKVILEFNPKDNLSKIRVQALHDKKLVGLVMPVRLT